MLFLNYRHELAAKAATKVASAGGSRLQNSAFANTVLAPVFANRFPYIITPYLGLRARLSQVWINRWTILLILVLVRTLLAITSLNEDIGTARREALSACSGVESMGSAMASMPHYMSQGVNALTADGVERAVNGLMSMLTLAVTGVEEIVLFVINMMTSTYVCLITLVVRGSLHAAIDLIEGASHFLNTTLGSIGDGIHTTVDDFESQMNDFIKGLDDVGSIFGGGSNAIPQLDISGDLSKLNNLQLPSGLDADLETLSKNIPTFEQVHNFTNNAIEWPFEEIKKLIKDALPNYKFDRNVLPVPQKEQLTFCSDNNGIDEFFDKLLELAILARKIAIAVLSICAILVCAPMAWLEVRRYRKLRERAALVRDSSTAPMDAVYIASRPFTASAGIKAASTFKAGRRQALVRWAIAYATTVPALFVLSLGLAGLLSCLSQYIILKAVQHEAPSLVNEVSEFASRIVTSLDHSSEAWANSTNGVILDLNGKINNDMFGWVNTSTHALNQTLNVFVDESIHLLHDAFGGTVLFGPVKELFNCLIGLKVAGIEKALTWIHEHAHVDFPLLPNNTFSLGAASSISNDPQSSSSFLANPSGGTADEITAIVNNLAAKIARSIRTEAIISSCVVAVWVLIALAGIFRVLWIFYGKGHMPSDFPGYDPDNMGAGPLPASSSSEPASGRTVPTLDAEKSPSFIGDFIHSPNIPMQTSSTSGSNRADRDRDRDGPPGYTTAHPANQYNGTSYTITPRPAPQFTEKTQQLYPQGPGRKPNSPRAANTEIWARPLSPVPENMGYAGERGVLGSMTMKPVEDMRRSQHGAFGAASHGASHGNGAGAGGVGVGARRGNGVTFQGMGY